MSTSDPILRQALVEQLGRDPDGYRSNLEMGLYCASQRDFFMQAEPFLRKALAHNIVDENTERVLAALGEIYSRRGQIDAAVATLRTLVGVFPHHLNHRFLLGDAITASADLNEASRVYAEARALLNANAQSISERTGRSPARILSPAPTLHRHIGELANTLDLFLKTRALGLIEPFEAILIAPADDTPNMCLVDCLREHVTVVSDRRSIAATYETYGDCPYFAIHVPLPDGRILHRDLAYGTIQRMWSDQGRPGVLSLPDHLIDEGRAALREFGLADEDWFACLHVRDRGFYGESSRDTAGHNELRNADIANYLAAARMVTRRGGWVFRVGDPTAPPLAPMERVIDYAHHPMKSPWLDIFLFASCRFLLGTRSGPLDVARAFGVPVLATDVFPSGHWNFRAADLVTVKLLVRETDGRILPVAEAMRPPFLGAWNPTVYADHGIRIVDNTADEIAAATEEMLDRLDGGRRQATIADPLGAAFARNADPFGLGHPVPIATDFLHRHPELAAGPAEAVSR